MNIFIDVPVEGMEKDLSITAENISNEDDITSLLSVVQGILEFTLSPMQKVQIQHEEKQEPVVSEANTDRVFTVLSNPNTGKIHFFILDQDDIAWSQTGCRTLRSYFPLCGSCEMVLPSDMERITIEEGLAWATNASNICFRCLSSLIYRAGKRNPGGKDLDSLRP